MHSCQNCALGVVQALTQEPNEALQSTHAALKGLHESHTCINCQSLTNFCALGVVQALLQEANEALQSTRAALDRSRESAKRYQQEAEISTFLSREVRM